MSRTFHIIYKRIVYRELKSNYITTQHPVYLSLLQKNVMFTGLCLKNAINCLFNNLYFDVGHMERMHTLCVDTHIRAKWHHHIIIATS